MTVVAPEDLSEAERAHPDNLRLLTSGGMMPAACTITSMPP